MTRQHTLRERFRSLYIWHRYLGLLAALFVLLLASTGMLLNHAHDLRLDRHYVQATWLLDAYGIQAHAPRSYAVGTHWISTIGQRVYLDSQEIGRNTHLHGALFTGQLIAVVLENVVALYTPAGEHLEDMPAPAPIVAAARGKTGNLLIRTAAGWWQTDDRFLAWSRRDENAPRFALLAAPTPATLQTTLLHQYRGTTLSWERVLLDLHSGRLFGKLGRYALDVVGLLLLGLALSGIVVWWQRRAQRLAHRRHTR